MSDEGTISEEDLTKSISHLPLVSIDLLVMNSEGSVLLGKRENRPAVGSWFVPGGRIRRMEEFDVAFRRIVHSELGLICNLGDAEFHGIFQHMYEDSSFSTNIGSHYVSIAMSLKIGELDLESLPQLQHKEYRWYRIEEMIHDEEVHNRTKDFFLSDIGIRPR